MSDEQSAQDLTRCAKFPRVRLQAHIKHLSYARHRGCTETQNAIMTNDERYILELLLLEIDLFRKGGVVRLLDTPRLLKSLVMDSLINLDYGHTNKVRPCNECQPFSFVSSHLEDVPCHHIFLNEPRLAIERTQDGNVQPGFEHVVTNWLRARVSEIRRTSH